MAPHKVDPRKSIYIRDHLERLLGTGRVRGKNPSQRIDRMVSRYDVLSREAFPKRIELTERDLLLLVDIVRTTDLSEPEYAMIIPPKIQQLADAGAATGTDTAGLAYRLKTLKLSELLAIVDVLEEWIGEVPQPTREDAATMLVRLRERTRL